MPEPHSTTLGITLERARAVIAAAVGVCGDSSGNDGEAGLVGQVD